MGGGYMITVNPCNDSNAEEVCRSVVEYASSMKHDGVLVVERTQRRGRAIIDRPHVHWTLNVCEKEAKGIEKKFMDRGLDVKLTLIHDPRGLCWYLAKDPEAAFYIAREEDHTGSGTPPSAAMEQQREGVPVVKDSPNPVQGKTEPFRTTDLFGRVLRNCFTHVLGFMNHNTSPLARLVRVGMARAP